MPKEIKNISDQIMSKIHDGKLKMRPRVYFVFGSILTFVGLVASIATSVFAVGLIRFLARSNGIWNHKLSRMLSIFPWWLLVLAVLGLVLGVILIRKYDFSYKVDFKKAIILTILAVILSGLLVDALGFNDLLARKGLMRGMMRNSPPERTR